MKYFLLLSFMAYQNFAWGYVHDLNIAATFTDTDCASINLLKEGLEIDKAVHQNLIEIYGSLPEDSPMKESYKELVDEQSEMIAELEERMQWYGRREAVRIGFQLSEDIIVPSKLITSENSSVRFHSGTKNNQGDVLLETNWSHGAVLYGIGACRYFHELGSVKRSAEKVFKEIIEQSEPF